MMIKVGLMVGITILFVGPVALAVPAPLSPHNPMEMWALAEATSVPYIPL